MISILKRFMMLFGILVVFLKIITISLYAQTNSMKVSYEEIDRYIQRQMDHLRIPGASLAIVNNNEIIHARGFGLARPGGKVPTKRTQFFIGSLTKSITALAVMQLVEAEKIDLTAPVQQYLPWFRVADSKASSQITVRHLLNQTSGMSESSGRIPLANFDQSINATELQIRKLSNVSLIHPVGSKFEYSNSNYNILGLIIENASGESYIDYIRHTIFNPLDMRCSIALQTTSEQNSLAAGHRYWFSFPVTTYDLPIPKGSLPSGQLISSSEDMAHFLIANLNKGRYRDTQILMPENVDELFHGVAESIQMGISFGKYGMGWFIDKIDQTEIAWHTGIVPHSFSYMAILPEQNKGVVLLVNTYGYLMTPSLSEIGAGVAALVAGQRPESSQVGYMTWIQRGILVIPILQLIGVIITLGRLKRWNKNPSCRPSTGRKWGLHILLPLIPNLLLTSMLIPQLSATHGFWMLYMPDFSWIAIICGGFAGLWIFLRSGLTIYILRKN